MEGLPLADIPSTPMSCADPDQYQFPFPAEGPSQGGMVSTSATPAQMMGGMANGGLQPVPQAMGVVCSGPAKPIYVAMGLERGEDIASADNCGVRLEATAVRELPFDPSTQYIRALDAPDGHFHPEVWATLQEVHHEALERWHNGMRFRVFFVFGTICRHFALCGAQSRTNTKGCGRTNCRWHHGKSREDLLAWIHYGPQGLQNFLLQQAMRARPTIVLMPVTLVTIPSNQVQLPDAVENSQAEVQHAGQPEQNEEGTLVEPTPSAPADAGDDGEHQVMPADGPH